MPHSSGGGSHGGGSHGGHGGSRSSTRTRTSSRPFHNSRRYVYHHNGQPRYFYAGPDFKPGFQWTKLLILIVYIPFIAMIFTQFKKVIPHVPQNYTHSIFVKDEANVISDENGVIKELKAFEKKTGVSPAVITINNEDWQSSYSSLENYAYDRYLQEFSDECHWLIVYSQQREVSDNYINWYWEGMQGDNTDSVLKYSETNRFTNSLYSYLESGKSVDDSLKKAFSEFTDTISMKPEFSLMITPLFMIVFLLFHAFGMLYPSIKYRNATLAPLDTDSGNTYGTGNSYDTGNTYNRSFNNTPYTQSNINTPKPYDPQAERRKRIINSGKNYTAADYRADKKARDAEFNKFINQYKRLINENNKNESASMPSIDSTPTASYDNSASYDNTASSSNSNLVTCQYCGSTFAAKYNKCPFCNARQ
ncbi:TPM domain-containing protein [Ruminococcus flavefaciens]|uniref:TPM domain-containing protein n=1 Tax=Ruminococcus flavefaciens TaxID=1265 RepID=A0A1M7L1C0_RUMFL|nr:TPM domain-containing protein [Ruminococcus flavefaciens]SHM71722.1 hypothetical protein SAMN04487860_11112 [Ruminococcus flavefaciens]